MRSGRTSPLRLAFLLLLLPAAGAARADILQLKDGRFVDGPKMVREADAVVVKYAHGEVRVPMTQVEDCFIEGAAPPEPANEEEKARRAEGLVRWKGKWVKPEVREKALKDEAARKKAELVDVQAHQEWRNRYQFETKNFKVESTLPPRLNEHYMARLEAFFEEGKKVFGVKVPKEWGKLKVCFYRDRKSFNQVSGGRGGVLAYYKFVAPRELNVFHDRTDPEETLACMYHETTHYLVDLVDEKSQYPHWINEAVAEYFGSAVVDPATKAVTFGAVQQGRLVEAKTDAEQGKRLALAQLIGSDTSDYAHYYWGWSFVHFMMETPAYRKKFLGYFFDLAKAKDVKREPMAFDFTTVKGDECLRIFQKRFAISGFEGLEKEWYAYLDKLQPQGVKGLEQAGQRAYQEGYLRFRAPRQLKAAIDGGSRSAAVQILYARCLLYRATDESRVEALAVIEKALAANPIEADLWAEKGFLLYAAGRADEAKPFVELAREMNPEDPYLDIDVMEALKGAQGE